MEWPAGAWRVVGREREEAVRNKLVERPKVDAGFGQPSHTLFEGFGARGLREQPTIPTAGQHQKTRQPQPAGFGPEKPCGGRSYRETEAGLYYFVDFGVLGPCLEV